MSYIRSLSNPEGLYMFGSGKRVEFYVGNASSLLAPAEEVNAALRKWARYHEGPQHSGGFFILETKDFKWLLWHTSWKIGIVLWDVTMTYIARRFER